MQLTEIFLGLKIENFQLKNFDIFLILAQNIDCGHTQSMFWSKNKKNRNTPAYPNFAVGFKGVYFALTCFRDATKIACCYY